MIPTPDTKGAQPEQLVEEARRTVRGLRNLTAGYDARTAVAWMDTHRGSLAEQIAALATALSECQDVAGKRSAALKGQIAETERLVLLLSECREREQLLLADVDLALTHYGMATSATGGPAMGDKEKRKHFGEAVAALRRVRNSLAAQSPSEASDGD